MKKNYDLRWKQWVNMGSGNKEDLKLLLNTDVDIEYKKRAISVLLSPDISSVQFYWNRDINEERPSLCDIPIVEELRDYYISTLCHFLKYVRTKEGDKYRKWEDYYNYRIIHIMKIKGLSHNAREELMDLFHLADAEQWSDPFDLCGYRPFTTFMCADEISDNYKAIVDAKMRDLIVKMDNPKEKKRAIWWYVELVWARVPKCPEYGYDIFITQVKFLVDNQYILRYDNMTNELAVPVLYDSLARHINIRCLFSVNVASFFLKTNKINWVILEDPGFSQRIISDLESIGEHDLANKVQDCVNSFDEQKKEEKRKLENLRIKAKEKKEADRKMFKERLSVL